MRRGHAWYCFCLKPKLKNHLPWMMSCFLLFFSCNSFVEWSCSVKLERAFRERESKMSRDSDMLKVIFIHAKYSHGIYPLSRSLFTVCEPFLNSHRNEKSWARGPLSPFCWFSLLFFGYNLHWQKEGSSKKTWLQLVLELRLSTKIGISAGMFSFWFLCI